ncbi:sensor histidine kinase [Streptomyces sp. NBC_01465]|uniref:sensor histidine kinase n=1 Tax=Streptomyces sp. NBC_01465 TaxID=2903878 RepID=UPI002E341EB4|nr:sensor histidine kinase [Streptomyces sp. NBC_01465]
MSWTGAVLRKAAGAPDLPLAAAAVLCFAGVIEVSAPAGRLPADLFTALVLVVGSTAPLAFLRGQLLLSAAAVSASVLLAVPAVGRPTGAGILTLLVMLGAVGLRCSTRTAVAFAVPFVGYALWAGGRGLALGLCCAAVAALGAGNWRRAGREARRRTAADWAYADTVLEHAARGERARIARELHDIVAHHISTLSVQAETARLTTRGLPPEGAERFLAIGETARLALTEMRRLLGVLREDAQPVGDAVVERAPQPGLHQLVALVDEARATAGGAVRLTVRGRVVVLDPGVELTAYRIVQEALTNARRHAPGVGVDVELVYGEGELRVVVRDGGPGAGDGSDGHGLVGMRERAAMAGGTLRTGAGPAGGFVVEAVLPAREAVR